MAIDLTRVELPAVNTPPLNPKTTYAASTAKKSARPPDNSVDMETGYDCFDPASHTANPRIGVQQRAWRQRLLTAMTRAKFDNFEKEWWHYIFPSSDQTIYDFEIR
mgnify:CR=1 FL=1